MAEKLKPGKIGGELSGAGLRFGIVVSRFNDFITERLLAASLDALERGGVRAAFSAAIRLAPKASAATEPATITAASRTSVLRSRCRLMTLLADGSRGIGECCNPSARITQT